MACKLLPSVAHPAKLSVVVKARLSAQIKNSILAFAAGLMVLASTCAHAALDPLFNAPTKKLDRNIDFVYSAPPDVVLVADNPVTVPGHTPTDTPTDTPVASSAPNAGFRVFNAMLYKDMPANFGERTAVVYEQSFYAGTPASDDDTPSDAGIRNAVQNALDQAGPPIRATGRLSVMDVERWPVWPFVTGDAHKLSIKRYASTLVRFGDALGTDVCAYAIAPQAGINHANSALKIPAIRQQWTEHGNVTRDGMVPHADALCPSLYAYYADTDGSGDQIEYWKSFAIETIKEARRIAPGKPVYPFIWPQFHQGGGMHGFAYIPAQYWRVIVETVRDNADGVVLWGGHDLGKGGQLPWNDQAEWVVITRDVLDL